MSLVGLLVALIVIGLIWWAITALLSAFGIGDPIATIVKVIFVVVVVLWIVSTVFGMGPSLRIGRSHGGGVVGELGRLVPDLAGRDLVAIRRRVV